MPDAAIVCEVQAMMRDYVDAFVSGTRDDLRAFVRLPVAYITDDEVQLREHYPFDPVKLRAATGVTRTDVKVEVIHANATKAHVTIEGVRRREDESVVEGIEAVYILRKTESTWKITALSGIRAPVQP